jgi:ubiquinone/menaquinone biosynthesis C-methylase UbiE
MDVGTKDLFSKHAAEYAKYRPTYPASLFRELSRLARGHECAWDVGTGNGQFASGLVHFFDRVIATDISEKQLAEAQAHPQIFYHLAKDSDSKIASGTVDFITVAQAMHWFQHKEFFREVKRVAKSDARLAVISYALCTVNPKIDVLTNSFYAKDLGEFWEPERKMVEDNYATVQFPFEEIEVPKFQMDVEWTANQYTNYLSTWSALKKAEKTKPTLLQDFKEKLFKVWDKEEKKKVVFPLSVRVFRC